MTMMLMLMLILNNNTPRWVHTPLVCANMDADPGERTRLIPRSRKTFSFRGYPSDLFRLPHVQEASAG
jgi:hypothetical protein